MKAGRAITAMVVLAGAMQLCASDDVKLVYVESVSASKQVSQKTVEGCLRQLLREEGLDGKQLPPIVVLHVGKADAGRADMRDVAVKLRWINDENGEERYYELWLIGDVNCYEVALALERVLERRFGTHHGEDEKKRTAMRVARWMEATVQVK